jgi:hypothetical protein
MNQFLRAKHWQLFLLTVAIPFIFQMVVMVTMTIKMVNPANLGDPMFMFGYMKIFPIMMALLMGVLFGWFWSVAVGLQPKVPAHVKMKVRKFKVFFFLPLIYLFGFLLFFAFLPFNQIGTESTPNLGFVGLFMAIVVPLHLFAMFCIFYSLYFVAKTFKTVELQREVTFSDFAGEFFLFWFFPIGVWIVQPKINRMVEPSAQ